MFPAQRYARSEYPDDAAAARWLAALRRDSGTPRAWPISILVAARWPLDSRWRRAFCDELLERAEESIADSDLKFIDILLHDRDDFVQELAESDLLVPVVALITAAASAPGYEDRDGAPDTVAAMQRALRRAPALALALARLRAVAKARATEYPLGARTRGVVIEGDDARVVTLAARWADGGDVTLEAPVCADPRVAASMRAGWKHAGARYPVALRLLDYAQAFDGASLGLAAMISCRNLFRTAATPQAIAAIGGGVEDPFTPQTRADLDLKLSALHAWLSRHARGVTHVAIAGREMLELPEGWDGTTMTATKSRDDVDLALSKRSGAVARLRDRWRGAVKGGGGTQLRRRRIEDALVQHLETQSLVLVTGEPNVGKSTFAGDLIRAWNHDPASGRAACQVTLDPALGLRDAAAALARELDYAPHPDEDIGRILEAIAAAWYRLGDGAQLVWFVDGLDTALETLAVGRLVEDIQRAQRATQGCLRLVGLIAAGNDWLDARVPYSVPRVEVEVFDDEELARLGVPLIEESVRELLRHPWAWRDRAAAERLARGGSTPLAFVQAMVDARLGEAREHPDLWAALNLGVAAMAEKASLSFARESALEGAADFVVVVDDRARLREGWLIEHALASALAKAERMLDGATMVNWLEKARREPAGDQPLLENALVSSVVRRIVMNAELDDLVRVRTLLGNRDPHVVVIAARALLTAPSWSSPAARAGFSAGDVWKRVNVAYRRASARGRVTLLRLGLLEGSDELIAAALVDGSRVVHHAACTLLQRRVSAARETGAVEAALQPLRQAKPGGMRLFKIVSSAIVAIAEAGRAGDHLFLDACKRAAGDIMHQVRGRNFLLGLARLKLVRRGVVGGLTVLARMGFNNVRSHNPMRNFTEVSRHFAIPVDERQRVLTPFIRFMGRDVGSAGADDALAMISKHTREAHQVPALAFAPAIWVMESSWGTLPVVATAGELSSRINALEELFERSHAAGRHAYAQSCLFVMFRQLWSAPDTVRDAAFESLPRYEATVERWIGATGGVYTTAAGNRLRILHLFRQIGLSRRLRGSEGEVFRRVLDSYPDLALALVEETLHLGLELEEWPLALALLGEIDARHGRAPKVAKELLKAKREIERRRRDIASTRAHALFRIQGRGAGKADAHAPDRMPPMTGISLAFEEMTYLLLRTSAPFRERWTAWMSRCADGKSGMGWYASGFELAYDLVYEAAPTRDPRRS